MWESKALNRLCNAANEACPWTLAENNQTFILSKALDFEKEKHGNHSPSPPLSRTSSKALEYFCLLLSHLYKVLSLGWVERFVGCWRGYSPKHCLVSEV